MLKNLLKFFRKKSKMDVGDFGQNPKITPPKIYSMHVQTNITNRFAKTLITSKVKNVKTTAQETTFSVILPEDAFISEFEMEIDKKIYKAYVKEKEEAKVIYTQAVSSGQSAAHVELNARDSKTFTVSVNIELNNEAIFRLTYEELLQRQNGQYELIINIHPCQIVDDLNVEVNINESRPLTFVKSPSLRTGNKISKDDPKLDPCAEISITNPTSASVKFSPNVDQQKGFAKLLGGQEENGIAGQFVVQYDVERDPTGGEVLVRDGYFVHFFSPSELEPIPKHVVFVLDHSGSMGGRKFEQLVDAMENILSDLKSDDVFHIVRFSTEVSIWDMKEDKFKDLFFDESSNYEMLASFFVERDFPDCVEAIKENIKKAINIIKSKNNMNCTNIIGGLVVALFLIKKNIFKYQEKNVPLKYQPMIIFLTDGLPNVGVHSGDEITRIVTKMNSGTNRASIFSLSFGEDADKNFLKKLSARNLGFSRHIYEAADASLQLQNFYRTISSPLLRDVNFKYVDEITDVTTTYFPIFFFGSELIVAGRTTHPEKLLLVEGVGSRGPIQFKAHRIEPDSSLERLWAYLTVKQMLNERETAEDSSTLTKKALALALKYSFVTSVSSLVVVKPDKTDSVDYMNATKRNLESHGHFLRGAYCQMSSPPLSSFGAFPNASFGAQNNLCSRGPVAFGSANVRHKKISKKICSIGRNVSDGSQLSCFESFRHDDANIFATSGHSKTDSSASNFNFGIDKADTNIDVFKDWIKTQHHLPQINDNQINLFLQSCYFQIESAKKAIEAYFSIRTLCSEIFAQRTSLISPIRESLDVVLFTFLPKKTLFGCTIIFVKLMDPNPNNFNFVDLLKYFDMVCSLYFNSRENTSEGHMVVFDMKALTLDHLKKFDALRLKTFLNYLQKAIPLRLKGLHCFNVVPFMDEVTSLIKPFVKADIMHKIYLHDTMDDLTKYVAIECLPQDYGGLMEPTTVLHEKIKKQLCDSIGLFAEEDKQRVNENKRAGQPKKLDDYFD